ncbi:hypothetical protein [Vibrio alginolyticus]|uniref:hypothetical protein n=1 Tax=Vibrio alginolyticus TaxID=663 RepID=UPI00211A809F|nr:hypothetical protein [Vibrio alginolyticus]MCQ9087354.1 hypothetical protein [Vibrio alginolyticus]
MSAVCIFVVLISGYIFSLLHLPARYKQNTSAGWDSYFNVAFWGIIWAFISFVFCFIAKSLHLSSTYIMPFFDVTFTDIRDDKMFLTVKPNQFIDLLKIAMWCAGTVFLAIFFGSISYLIFKFETLRYRLLWRISGYSHFDSMMLESQSNATPMLITISSKKVYVGLCLGEDFVDGHGDSVAIIPLMSGYRNGDTQDISFTTNYYKQYQNLGLDSQPTSKPIGESQRTLSLDDFRVVIAKREIHCMSFFDIEMYAQWEGICEDIFV